jgi:hypothetical protein
MADGPHGTDDSGASSSQHALGLGGPLHFRTSAALIGKGQGKITWAEGDRSPGKLKRRFIPWHLGEGKGRIL